MLQILGGKHTGEKKKQSIEKINICTQLGMSFSSYLPGWNWTSYPFLLFTAAVLLLDALFCLLSMGMK